MLRARPDPHHPVTEGYACLKAKHLPDLQNDPDRLLHPIRRNASGWERVSWELATTEIGRRLRAIRDRYGPRAIATYWGNAADSTAISLANTFCHAFGSPNSFNVVSLEYTSRGAVARRMFGNENFALQPETSRASFALLLGTNPVVTNGMAPAQRLAGVAARLKAIQRRRGKVVVVDPRRTETAKLADDHLAIRPGTDLFLLLALIQRIIRTDRIDAAFLARHATGLETWRELSDKIDPDRAAEVTGIARSRIERLADEFAAAEGAFATTRVGVLAGHNPALTDWALMTLNAITGNIDRPGGMYFHPGVFDVPRLIERFSRRHNAAASRIGGYPQIFGGPPASVLADDVLSEDADRVRALIVVGGNPAISFPNTSNVENALRRLELLVCIDPYLTDTGSFAHYVLPAATAFERGSIHFLASNFEPYPFVEWRPQLVPPRGEARPEWQIFKDLSRAAGVRFLNDPWIDRLARVLDAAGIGFGEDWFHRYLLLGKARVGRLKRSRGLKLGGIRWGEFVSRRLQTSDRKIQLAAADLVAALGKALDAPVGPTVQFPFLLISGARRAASFNSWVQNLPALMGKLGGNWAILHPDDAARIGVEEGRAVRITSPTGRIEIPVVLSHEIRAGVVAVHQLWGYHRASGASTLRRHPGVNVNMLHDDRQLDPFSGMPVFNGTPCRVEPVV